MKLSIKIYVQEEANAITLHVEKIICNMDTWLWKLIIGSKLLR